MTKTVYLSLGSNLGDREGNLRAALGALSSRLAIDSESSLYETDPVGVTDQPAFLNLAVAVRTPLSPEGLLSLVKGVERSVGRTPTYRWGPRVVDVDILLYGDETFETPELTIPHVEMHRRAFVLVPLAEIAPEVVHPILGRSIGQLRDEVAGRETVRRVPWDQSENRSSAHGSPSM